MITINNIILSFILTTLAGLSTLLGTIFIFYRFKNTNQVIAYALSFAAGIMISVSIGDLIPQAYIILSVKYTFIINIMLISTFILIGFIISTIISRLLPQQQTNSLYKVGLITMFSIIVHNLFEGLVTFVSSSTNMVLGFSLAVAITLHNIPEGISIALPIYYATNNKTKAIVYTAVAALSEPLGVIITFACFRNSLTLDSLGLIFPIIAGIMLQISIYELIPEAINSYKCRKNILFFISGVLIMFLTLLLLS